MKSITYRIQLFLIFLLMGKAALAQDWANLNRFKEVNKNLPVPAVNENRVVFMGNSITEGWLQYAPNFFSENPNINRGISGQTTPQMLLRFRDDVIDLHPKAVVILAGTNDIAGNTGPMTLDEIMDNLKSMSELAKAHEIKVILCSILPAFDYPWRPGLKPNEKIPALNKMIQAYAKANGHIYLDYFSAMADDKNGLPTELSADGVHPNAAGYKVMEPLVEKAITEALQ